MHRPEWSNPANERRLAFALLLTCWVVCAAAALTERVDRDEHMYLAAAALSADHRIYEDFAFLQTPYSVGVYRAVRAISPGNWTLLPARLFKILLTGTMLALLYAVLLRLGARPLLAAGLISLLYQDDLILQMAGIARNYDLAQVSVLVGFATLPLRPDDRAGPGRLLVVGMAASAAVGFKLTYAPLALLMLGWAALAAPTGRPRRSAWVALGAILGAVPAAIVMAGVDPLVLRASMLDYHFLNAEFHVLEGYEPYATVWDRLTRTIGTILSPEHRPISAMVTFGLALNVAQWSRPRAWVPGPRAVFVLGAVAGAILIAAIPRPVQGSYFAPAFVVLTMLATVATARLTERGQATMLVLCLGFSLVSGIWRAPTALGLVREASDPDRWTGVVTHRSGQEIARLARGDLVATTHPVFALEAGATLYPEFATGEFAWRLGALLGPERRALLHSTSAGDLARLLAERPPDAVVTEIDAPWDGPLVEWATARDLRATVLTDPEIRAWTD